MNRTANPFHPDLQSAARFFPSFTINPMSLRIVRWLFRLIPASRGSSEVAVENVQVPGPEGAPTVRVRIYRPKNVHGPMPALLWIHGGGYVMGTPDMDDFNCIDFARELGILVVSVDYRLAPEHPFPAPLEDCYAALRWLFKNAETLGVLSDRIGIGGASAGGGLAAALAQLAHDRQEVRPVLQLLVYPMLDDRTTARTDFDDKNLRGWNQGSNVFGWRSYLGFGAKGAAGDPLPQLYNQGQEPGGAEKPTYAVPSRRQDLSGLPPAWIGVGTCDLFHDEDLDYAARLKAAGVPCDLVVVPGAFHGFDGIRSAAVARDFRDAYKAALRRGLFVRGSGAG